METAGPPLSRGEPRPPRSCRRRCSAAPTTRISPTRVPMPTCRTCKRLVVMVRIDGQLMATENALINVVPAFVTSDSTGQHVQMGDAPVQARQLHAALCPVYAEQDRRKRLAGEQRAFERQQQRAKGRNYGL